MKFKVKTANLLTALENVQRIADKKSLNPILSNVLFIAEDNTLMINASDTKIDILMGVEAEITRTGKANASASMLLETVKALPKETDMFFEVEENHLHLKCGSFKSSLSMLNNDEFPTIQRNYENKPLIISYNSLSKIIDNTHFSISTDVNRYYLNGLYIHYASNDYNQQVLKAVATDGHRLSLSQSILENPIESKYLEEKEGVIIPKKTVDEITKLKFTPSEKETQVKIYVSEQNICFKFSNITLTSQLITGMFPDYTAVIPAMNKYIIEINKTTFMQALNVISQYSDQGLIQCIFNKNKTITLKAIRNDASGTHNVEFTPLYDEYDENALNDLSLGFNPKYLIDILKVIKTDTFSMKFADTEKVPVILSSKENSNEIFVVMPTSV